MKKIFLFSLIFIISCNQEPNVDYGNANCFQQKDEKNQFKDFKPVEESIILNAKYPNLEISEIKNPTKFDENYYGLTYSFKDVRNYISPNNFEYLRKFNYQNQDYFLAKDQFGYWLIEYLNTEEKPYFLGIAYDKYIHIKNSDKFPLIENGKIILEAAFIRQIEAETILISPPKYEALKDNILIKLDLEKVKKDSDQDSFNDIFEEYVGLNPNSKDSDNDGKNDFEDTNPKYKSEKSDFTELYETLLKDNYDDAFSKKKSPYNFSVFLSDCDFFKKVNPISEKVLFFPKKDIEKTNFNVEENGGYDFSKITRIGKNSFKIRLYYHNGGNNYEFKKTRKGWKIEMVTNWII